MNWNTLRYKALVAAAWIIVPWGVVLGGLDLAYWLAKGV